MRKKKLLPPSHVWVEFHTNPPKFLNVVKSFRCALSGSIACYEKNGDLNLAMLKEIFYNSLKDFEINNDLGMNVYSFVSR